MLFGIAIILAALTLRVRTRHGVIVLENVPEDAVVEVDGDRVEFTPRVGRPVTIERPTGRHVVVVKRGDEVLIGEAVVLDSNKPYRIGARIEVPATSLPVAGPAPAAQPGPVPAPVSEPTLPAADREGWVPLFNGRDTTNWGRDAGNRGTWRVVNGVLEGRGGDELGQMAILPTTRRDYSDFRLRARIFNVGSGGRIKVRMVAAEDPTHVRDGYGIRVGGTRSAIGDWIPLGSIQEDSGRPRKTRIEWDVLAEGVPAELGSCYTLEITAIGNRISTSINGKKVAEFVDETNPALAGKIALFCRARDAIRFQEISILELPADPARKSVPPRGAGTAGR
jgi:hypothetical protein